MTPLVAKATRAMLDAGVRDVRNQGVLMRGVNDDAHRLLDLCFALQDEARIMPYYFYMCDMIPSAEHWRVSVAHAQELQHEHHGLPARLRDAADRLRRAVRRQALGAPARRRTTASAASRTGRRTTAPRSSAPTRTRCPARYEYYDPIDTLPAAGQEWWREHAGDHLAAAEIAARASREAAEAQKELADSDLLVH